MSEEWDELRREYDRVRVFADFDSRARIWWIYLRAAVERWLERNEDPAVRAAHDGVKEFPEHLPDERRRWLALREAVAGVLGEQASS